MSKEIKHLESIVLFACQNDSCAEEHSYPIEMMYLWKGKPICDNCVGNEPEISSLKILPAFDPFAFIQVLEDENIKFRKALEWIATNKEISISGIHRSHKMRNQAKLALKKCS